MADILVQKDANNLIPKLGITAGERAAWAVDYTIYDINADGSKGAAYGPTSPPPADEVLAPDTTAQFRRDDAAALQSLVSGARTAACPARIYVSAPISAAPTKTTAAEHTYDVQIPAKRAFYGVQFIFQNFDTAAAMAIAGARCASPRRHLLDTGADIAAGGGWSPLLTVAGATSWSVPIARVAAVTNHFLPGTLITDFYPLTPQARTDSATNGSAPLVRCRSRNAGNVQYPYNCATALPTTWNAYAGNGGLLIGSNMTNAADQVTDPTADGTSVSANGGYIATPAAIFYYNEPGKSVFAFGDSLFQGNGSSVGISAANGILGWPLLVHVQNPLIDTCNFAVTGENTVDSMATLKSVLGALTILPAFVALKVYSPNDGNPTQALIDTAWGRVLEACAWLRSQGITPLLFTSPPVNAWTSGQHAFNEAQNARAVALAAACPWLKLVDMATIVSNPANRRQILPAFDYDGTHFLDAGHQAVADAVVLAVG